jgi:Sec-independent protein translocase protein TatA
MFDVGLPEIAVLLIAGLFIFGPERLPTVAAQAARTLRQIRSMAAGARAEIDEAIGPELRDFNAMAGLGELAGLRDQLSQVRDLTPRKILNDTMSGATAGAVAGADAATTDRPGAQLPTGDGSATVPARPTVPAQSATVFDADAT